MSLTLPRRPDEPLANPPLKAVACQISFDDLGEVTRADAQEIQKSLGRSLWPTLKAADLITGVLAPTGITQQPARRAWQLQSSTDSYSVGLRPDNVSLETQNYEGWKEFRVQLEALIKAVEDIFSPSRMLRLGVRYINQLTLEDGQLIGPDIITERLLGILLDERFGPSVSATEQTVLLDVDETAGIKCILRHGLYPRGDGPRSYLLDIDINQDGTTQAAGGFGAKKILESAERLHDTAWDIFCASLADKHFESLAQGE